MSIHKKLQQARVTLQSQQLKKSGHNKFAGYTYFELEDFLKPAQKILNDLGLCGVVSFTESLATLTITDVEDSTSLTITCPMSKASLKGCHDVQNLGAVITYTRRYLWTVALEICESDAIDAPPQNQSQSQPQSQAQKPLYTIERASQQIANWLNAIENDGKTVEAILTNIATKFTLTAEVKDYIKSKLES